MDSELVNFKRHLQLQLPKQQSAFFWGARKTGKSTYLKAYFPNAIYYDLLKTDLFFRFAKQPHLLREEVLALPESALNHPIIIDEIQKIPQLLNEIHWLIENTKAFFILCGSSARKLKHQSVNLLGGRALIFHFYPLVYPEIPEFDLLRALNQGLIPSHYLAKDAKRLIKAYLETYLKEEIQAEGLTRNLPSFARFLDALAFTHGELTNYSNIARDCGVDAKTVRNYYQILIDSLVGYFVEPFNHSNTRQIISAVPKFYLVDVGLVTRLKKITIEELKGFEAGKAFEHYIFTEIIAYRGLNDAEFDIRYWRTKTGLEVDFVLGQAILAIEIKISSSVSKIDLKGLITFKNDFPNCQCIAVTLDQRPRRINLDDNAYIEILPWQDFLKKLWTNQFKALL